MYRNVLCLVMAGGKGSRYGSPSKIVTNICGKPLIEHIIVNIKPFCRDIIMAISKYTSSFSEVVKLCIEEVECIETTGEGYIEDLLFLACSLPKPILIVAGDIVTHRTVIEDFISKALEIDRDVITMTISRNGIEEPIGISLYRGCGGSWTNIVYSSTDAIDIDTLEDLEIAKNLCRDVEVV
ncbi:GTP:adenosylcobinamide-phosphateguanylyltransfer ase [Ignisphaera aggregans DSM 17230]|uniref:GTP:adenosylcobinamide-phosphateguanylyltransfer ase n=1 Tax=Ignisphaera aggregans (strain DSM 17230 / JCM 13409 / AQ1.S1) TaxID=583356 RepID=E0SR26_IGNAA|nr:GTP:adenosylcobinamide-phosphateguanylyltransfer ase [Ignisphaera aggregans DSM 17230]